MYRWCPKTLSVALSCFFVLFILSETRAKTSPLIMSNTIQKDTLKGDNILIYVDSSNTLTAHQILEKIKTPNFYCAPTSSPYNANCKNLNFWMYFEVLDLDSSSNFYYLEVPDFHVSDVEVYALTNTSLEKIGQQGFSNSFATRNVNYKNPTFVIYPQKNKGYLVKMNSKFGSSYKMYLSHPTKKLNFATNEYLRLGLFYGILLAMFFYNLFIFFISKNKSYLYYVGYVSCCIWYSFFTDGLGFQYLWPNLAKINNTYNYTSLLLLISFSAYSIHFLRVRLYKKTLYFSIIGSIAIYCVVFMINQTLTPFDQLATWTYVLPYLLIVYAIIKRYQEGQNDLRFFIIAYTTLCLSVITHVLMRKEIIPDNFYGIYSLNIGFILEVIFLSLAQGDRVRLIHQQQITNQRTIIEKQKENELLKDKVNRELESLVEKRTTEIKQKNEELAESYAQLEKLNEQIYEMNRALDVNVWQLKKQVAHTKKTVVLEKSIDFTEFINAFPTNLSCYQFLHDKKWGEGFCCKKCGNTKEAKNTTLELKKCSKCDTIESVTSGTIFHRVKFPIQKAFYIAIVTFKNNPMTNKVLSEKIDLRESTVSAFRKKIKEKIAEKSPENFDDLIF